MQTQPASMAESKPFPKSIRFEQEVEDKIGTLAKIFNESEARVLHRAVNYLFDNKEQAIEDEALERKRRAEKFTSK